MCQRDTNMKVYYWCSNGLEDLIKDVFESLGFQEEENVQRADIILIEPPFPIINPLSLRFEVPEKKWAFFMPKDVLEEIRESKNASSSYEILKPFALLSFLSFIKKELGSEA